MNDLTQSELRALLHYDATTGIFTWLSDRISGRNGNQTHIRAGTAAGTTTSHGYIAIQIGRKCYKAHRLAWLYIHGGIPKEIDHINRNRSDNRIKNLRSCTRAQNMQNKSLYRNNVTGITGITINTSRAKPFVARCRIAGRGKHVGYFSSLEEAVCARDLFIASSLR